MAKTAKWPATVLFNKMPLLNKRYGGQRAVGSTSVSYCATADIVADEIKDFEHLNSDSYDSTHKGM